ncbi:MAG: site-specific DNA-methyltransferase [Chloroflexi bacterium CFX4]|nr:site-specific DNA-methyltransferase [Chloroflexi bacterium CFX4]MDL1921514.1 site-specific DNA-methyltransferase [Chloroflexi bacterium CFX3]
MLSNLEAVQENNAALEARFADKLKVNYQLNRQLVSFQANKNKPVYRWFKYKEGFSEAFVQHLLDYLALNEGHIIDPFAGTGTVLFVASERGLQATGIELLPVGCEIMHVRKLMQNDDVATLQSLIERWRREQPWQQIQSHSTFPHLRITHGAFPEDTQRALERYLAALASERGAATQVLRFAAMCVLEEISYTRKDGQYLRWDYRSGRRQRSKPFDKGKILNFEEAITCKLDEISLDLQPSGFLPGFFGSPAEKGKIEVLRGSCLDVLPTLEAASFDGLITSPPYANRYDYTRTYALELALLGIGEIEIRELRQAMVSCTVENREKTHLQNVFGKAIYQQAAAAFDNQQELQAILSYLEWQKSMKMLNNAGIPRMIRHYFFELALVIFECARLLKPKAPFVMVNDNVRYGGVIVPVDLILSDFAERAGFDVEVIWVLPTGKGNSSQQMGTHGRQEVRKCVYIWRRRSE